MLCSIDLFPSTFFQLSCLKLMYFTIYKCEKYLE